MPSMVAPEPVHRRRFLQGGALGGFLTLPELLRAGSRADTERSCILIVQQGGPSHIDTWDMKPDAPREIRGALTPIATSVPGIHICELLPRLAARADKYCLLRTLTHTNNDHDAGMHMFLSGRAVPVPDAPYLGSIAGRLRPPARNFPAYVWIQELEFQGSASARYTSGGHLGFAQAPFLIGRGADNFANPAFQVNALAPPQASASNACANAAGCSRPFPAVKARPRRRPPCRDFRSFRSAPSIS